MTRWRIGLWVGTAAALLLGLSCEEPVDRDNECTDAIELKNLAISEYCDGRVSYCCQCACWDRGWVLADGVDAQGSCACVETPIQTSTSDALCLDARLEDARECLVEPAACMAGVTDTVAEICENTRIT